MDRKARVSLKVIGWLMILLMIGSDSGAGGDTPDKRPLKNMQPYEYPSEWSWVAPIDGPGYCGPASLYHIISYFKDYGSFSAGRSRGDGGGRVLVDIPVIARNRPRFIEDTVFGRYIQPNGLGSGWNMLKKVGELCTGDHATARKYDVFVCSGHTAPKKTDARNARLMYIRDRLLTKNIPVVVHLTGAMGLYGHYVTLIGVDVRRSLVYYVDSLKNTAGIHAVPLEDFTGSWFYVSGKFYKARWDGEWMAFWHPGSGVDCDRCGD